MGGHLPGWPAALDRRGHVRPRRPDHHVPPARRRHRRLRRLMAVRRCRAGQRGPVLRELGGPALLVPAEYECKGASLLDAVRIQRAVASRSPSLAGATTMHHFSVSSLADLAAARNGFEWAMHSAIAENSWLLSSGFA